MKLHRTLTVHDAITSSYDAPTMVEAVEIDTDNIDLVHSTCGVTATLVRLKSGDSIHVIESEHLILEALGWTEDPYFHQKYPDRIKDADRQH